MIPVILMDLPQAESAYKRCSALEKAAATDPSLIECRWFRSRYDAAREAWRKSYTVGGMV